MLDEDGSQLSICLLDLILPVTPLCFIEYDTSIVITRFVCVTFVHSVIDKMKI